MTDLIERAKATLEAGEPHCTKCGHKRSEHNYRHPFQPSHTATLEALAPDLARLAIAGAALAELIESDLTGTEWKRECLSRVARFRAIAEDKE